MEATGASPPGLFPNPASLPTNHTSQRGYWVGEVPFRQEVTADKSTYRIRKSDPLSLAPAAKQISFLI